MKRNYIAAFVLVIIALVAGISNSIVSKPYVSDRMITQDLRSLSEHIRIFDVNNQMLPETLDELDVKGDLKNRIKNYEYTQNSPLGLEVKKSPRSGLEFRPDSINQQTYTLCATFKTSTLNDRTKLVPAGFNPEVHEKGRQCFTEYVAGIEPASSEFK